MQNSKKNHYLCSALQMANNMRTRTLLVILLMAICFIVKAADGTTTYNGLTRKLVTEDFTGSVHDGQLHFVLHITSSMLGITMADATLTFDGESK